MFLTRYASGKVYLCSLHGIVGVVMFCHLYYLRCMLLLVPKELSAFIADTCEGRTTHDGRGWNRSLSV